MIWTGAGVRERGGVCVEGLDGAADSLSSGVVWYVEW